MSYDSAAFWKTDGPQGSGNVRGLAGPVGQSATGPVYSTIVVPYVLSQSAVPSGVAPTGSVAANGALTLGTALAATYTGGIWLNLPAGAAFAGSPAGSYWCAMSSTTLGTIYNVTLGATVPFIPINPPAIVAAGPGAYTGVTTIQTVASVTVPGGAMGPNGALRIGHLSAVINNANTKTVSMTFGATTVAQLAMTTTAGFSSILTTRNRGVQNLQVLPGLGTGAQAMTTVGSVNATAIDTSVAQTFTFSGTLAVATDYAILESFTIEVLPGA